MCSEPANRLWNVWVPQVKKKAMVVLAHDFLGDDDVLTVTMDEEIEYVLNT